MGFFDRLMGDPAPESNPIPRNASQRSDDEIALERYRYLLKTAPPETIEAVHAEAFAKLTDQQRGLIFAELTETAPAGDAPRANDPASLAAAATRSELRQPGTLERSFQGPSFAGMVGSSLLGTVAGYVIGSALVGAFMPNDAGQDAASDPATDADTESSSADSGDTAGDFGDGGGMSDFGGGMGDFGGDFGF